MALVVPVAPKVEVKVGTGAQFLQDGTCSISQDADAKAIRRCLKRSVDDAKQKVQEAWQGHFKKPMNLEYIKQLDNELEGAFRRAGGAAVVDTEGETKGLRIADISQLRDKWISDIKLLPSHETEERILASLDRQPVRRPPTA